jgi:hypothetical protein
MSFLRWLRSLFAKLGAGAGAAAGEDDGDRPPRLSPMRELTPVAPASTRASEGTPAPGDIEDFDLTQGCEYAAAERVPLTLGERDQVQRLSTALRLRFNAAQVEAQPFPARSSRLFALLEDPDFDMERLVLLTQRDPALSASVLRVANSAASASREKVDSLRDAIVRLGAQTVAGIAAALSTRGVFDTGMKASRGLLRDLWGQLWLHSVSSAFAAGSLSIELRKGNLEHCFLAGMLHEIGKTFALRDVSGAWREMAEAGEPSLGVVAAALETVHVEFGAAAARAWKLPDFLIEVCEKHHLSDVTTSAEVQLVRLASGLTAIHLSPNYRVGSEDEVYATAASLGMDNYALRAFRSQVRSSVVKARAL